MPHPVGLRETAKARNIKMRRGTNSIENAVLIRKYRLSSE